MKKTFSLSHSLTRLLLVLSLALVPGLALAQSPAYPMTYTCGVSNQTPAATPTNIYTVSGSSSANILVRITQIHFMGMSLTAGAIATILVNRQSTADSGGTFVLDGINPYDKLNPASTVTCGHYTVNPAAVGTVAGTARRYSYLIPVATSFPSGEILEAFGDGVQPLTLRNGETLAFNLAGATVTGFNYTLQVEYTETPIL